MADDLIKRLRHADAPYAKPTALEILTDEAADLIEQQAARIAELEAQIAASEKHRNDLADKIMSQQTEIGALKSRLSTVAPAVDAQPVAWRIIDGEGGYDYRDEPPPEVNVAWAAKHGRKYEPLYTEPQSSQSAQSEPVDRRPVQTGPAVTDAIQRILTTTRRDWGVK
jgi:uncharacterized coiled-coil protein SlyX